METRADTNRRLTLPDHIYVLLDCLCRVHGILKEALAEMRNDICVDLRFVNGRIHSAVILCQSLLDGIVAVCKVLSRLDDREPRVSFHDFVFDNTAIAWIDSVQTKVNELRFNRQSFAELADSMRHTPWVVRSVTRRGPDAILDYYSIGERTGFMYGMMLPLYKHTRTVLCRLATQCGVNCYSVPTM